MRIEGQDFVGTVSGINPTDPLTDHPITAIEAGRNRFAVRVFHDRHFDDETQRAFIRDMRRTTIRGDGVTAPQLQAA